MSSTLNNLIKLGENSLASANFSVAEDYFRRSLELDVKNVDAWHGLAKAVISQVSKEPPRTLRINESLPAFKNAIKYSNDERKKELEEECIDRINKAFEISYKHEHKLLIELAYVEHEWSNFVTNSALYLDYFDQLLEIEPKNEVTLKNIVEVTLKLLEGVAYIDILDKNIPKEHSLTEEYEVIIRAKLDSTVEALQKIDPEYKAPFVYKSKHRACFVITATMDNEDHFAVSYLRNFRSKYLSGTFLGDLFIGWYYKKGPKLASLIRQSKARRLISFLFIVLPALAIAYALINSNKIYNKFKASTKTHSND